MFGIFKPTKLYKATLAAVKELRLEIGAMSGVDTSCENQGPSNLLETF